MFAPSGADAPCVSAARAPASNSQAARAAEATESLGGPPGALLLLDEQPTVAARADTRARAVAVTPSARIIDRSVSLRQASVERDGGVCHHRALSQEPQRGGLIGGA